MAAQRSDYVLQLKRELTERLATAQSLAAEIPCHRGRARGARRRGLATGRAPGDLYVAPESEPKAARAVLERDASRRRSRVRWP